MLLHDWNYTVYYFYQDSLIFAKIITYKLRDKSHKQISSGKYYFWNGNLFDKQEDGKPAQNPEALLEHARHYIRDAKE